MRICVLLEGCYPYITGGVSSWIHQYIQAMPEHEFIIWAIGADAKEKGNFKYQLPKNVVEIQEVFLGDALKLPFFKRNHKFKDTEKKALLDFLNCRQPDWSLIFDMYHTRKINPVAFLRSQEFMDFLTQICREEYPYVAFCDFFHTVRSMMLPLLYVIGQKVPKADCYHAIATGYSGILARLGGYLNRAPYIITEHGIYTREREEEIIRAKWVIPAFKKFWIRYFYMLSEGAYEKASMVTALFERARHIQIDMGVDPSKSRYILNGIRFEDFDKIPPKQDNGYIDIGAVLRIAPIKDVKTMIYAFYELKRRVENARLYIVGPEDDEAYAKECYALVRQLELEDIIFTGTVNVREYLGKFDFTLLSSISEGQPLAVLESFAAGRPCVTTDVGCCKELIFGMQEGDDLGAAGFCVPPMHREALCSAMERMCVDTKARYQMGKAAKERARRYFRHEEMIKNYQEMYGEVLKKWRESDSA